MVCMVVLAVATRDPVPSAATISRVPLWASSGGTFGAIFIGLSIATVPKLGGARPHAKLPSKKPVNKGAKGVPKRDPRSISWLVVAGPPEASVQTPIIAPLWGLASSSRAVHLARGYEFGNRNRGFPEAEGLQQAKVRIWSEVRILNMGENQ
jgi:hypothetical protein